ncbi:glutathione S-transferase omega-2-like isoform X2 [Bacillus rossius redtenbacheri]
MEFCPYAQRARIVLLVKNVPHDIVNIDLQNKPEWYFDVHPQGKVPALDTGDEVVVESLDIANFLDKKFPDPPLYPADADLRDKDKELLNKFEKVPVQNKDMVLQKDLDLPSETSSFYQAFNEELEQRGTPFLGGSSPSMTDYMIWPWIERAYVPVVIHGKEKFLEEGSTKFPKVVEWKKNMESVKAVANTTHTVAQLAEVYKKLLSK